MNTTLKNKWSNPQVKNKEFESVDLLSTITAVKDIKNNAKRKPLNLSFAFDTSSSMEEPTQPNVSQNIRGYGFPKNDMFAQAQQILGHNEFQNMIRRSNTKLDLVKKAALVALNNLNEEDIVSIVTFDSNVKVLASGVSGANKEYLKNIINSIYCNGMTALFDGWKTATQCVVDNMKEGYINRVLLLTDGQANQGLTNPDSICTYVHELSKSDVTTSTFGVGNNYNEDLLQNMAMTGEGNYYYIQNESQFEEMFSYEFSGLINLLCKKVSLSLTYEGWESFNLLNDFNKNEDGTYKLPNITNNIPLDLIFQGKPINDKATVKIEISYLSENGESHKISSDIAVDVVNNENEKYLNQDVIDKSVVIKIANKKKEAIKALDSGNIQLAEASLSVARGFLATASASLSETQSNEIMSLNNSLKTGDSNVFRKSAAYQSYNATNSKIK